jgi:hypothetical protein
MNKKIEFNVSKIIINQEKTKSFKESEIAH